MNTLRLAAVLLLALLSLRTYAAEATEPTYTITTSSVPVFGGTTTGAGTYEEGANVTLIATPNLGYLFSSWAEAETIVSTSPTYSFAADADRTLTARFVTDHMTLTFNLDQFAPNTPLPLYLWSEPGEQIALTSYWGGAGYTVQDSGILGFTPYGFVGNCIYPSSGSAADFRCAFSSPIDGFSITYATDQFNCQTGATLRLSVYTDTIFVATTTTRAPSPGTWPSGTLSIHAPGGVNTAVVHYEAPPTGCQSSAPIFMVDNVTVTRLCHPPTNLQTSNSVTVCQEGSASFHAWATHDSPIYFQWQRQRSDGLYVDLADGPTSSWDGGAPGVGGIVTGATTDTMTISAATAEGKSLSLAHATRYRCFIYSPCGGSGSGSASLAVSTADFNADGDVGTDADIEAFFACLAGNCCYACGLNDFDGDGNHGTDADIEAFFRVLAGGQC